MILVFSQDPKEKAKSFIEVRPDEYKYGEDQGNIFLVKQTAECKRKNFYQWRFAKALEGLDSYQGIPEDLKSELSSLTSSFKTEGT